MRLRGHQHQVGTVAGQVHGLRLVRHEIETGHVDRTHRREQPVGARTVAGAGEPHLLGGAAAVQVRLGHDRALPCTAVGVRGGAARGVLPARGQRSEQGQDECRSESPHAGGTHRSGRRFRAGHQTAPYRRATRRAGSRSTPCPRPSRRAGDGGPAARPPASPRADGSPRPSARCRRRTAAPPVRRTRRRRRGRASAAWCAGWSRRPRTAERSRCARSRPAARPGRARRRT